MLTPKQSRFVDEYLIDLNATQAATRAGYSARTANEQGARLLANVSVRSALTEAMKARQARTHITQDRVLEELSRIAFFDIRRLYTPGGALKPMHELDDVAAAVLAGVDVVEMQGGMRVDNDGAVSHVPMFTKKAKVFDKGTALTLAMRHLGMLQDKTEFTGPNGGPLQSVSMSQEEFRAIASEIANKV